MITARTTILTVLLLSLLCMPFEAFALSVTITSTATNGGSISPKGAVKVASGASKTFTIKPAKGYLLATVLVNGESKGRISSYTFQNVTANAWIQAIFVDSDLFLDAANIMVNDPATGANSTLAAAVDVVNTRLIALEKGIVAEDGKIPASSISFDALNTSFKAKTVQEALLETKLRKEDLVGTWLEYFLYEMSGDEEDVPAYQITFRDDGTYEEIDLEFGEVYSSGTWSIQKGIWLKEIDRYVLEGEQLEDSYTYRVDKAARDQLFLHGSDDDYYLERRQ